MNLKKLCSDGQLVIPNYPIMFFLDLTEKCNLNCWFCYNQQSSRIKQDANLEDIKKILDIMYASRCDEVIYLGGEPTIYPHFFEVLDYADYLGFKQSFVTNGQFLDRKFVERLTKIKTLEIGISLHSCYSSVQNDIAGKENSFANIERTIKALEKANISWYSQTSLLKSNYLTIRELYEFLWQIGHPSRMDLSRMVVGNNPSDKFLNETDYIRVFEQINSLDTKKLPIRIEAFPRCWLLKISNEHDLNYKKLKESVRPCYAWIGQISVDIHGNVRLCPTGGKIAGNILKNGIDGVWRKNSVVREFQQFKWQKSECLECEDFAFCVGACKMTCSNIDAPLPDKYIVEGGMFNACYN